jgi:DnaJ-class molecular chaperone
MEFHPDRNPGDAGAEARFKEIAEAHTILNDPERRKHYDETGETGSATDRAMAILLTQVSAALSSAMNKLAANGESANEVDVVQVMRDDIKKRKVEVQKGLYHLGRVRDNLEKAKDRFQTEGADNVFEEMVESHLRQVQAETKNAELELKKADELLAFLSGYTFKRDLNTTLWTQVNCTPWKL